MFDSIQEAARAALDSLKDTQLPRVAMKFTHALNVLSSVPEFRNNGEKWRDDHPITKLFTVSMFRLSFGLTPFGRNYADLEDECKRIAESTPTSTSLDGLVLEEVLCLLEAKSGSKITTIALLRARTGLGLADAKDLVEIWMTKHLRNAQLSDAARVFVGNRYAPL